jgi:hypothetical protein
MMLLFSVSLSQVFCTYSQKHPKLVPSMSLEAQQQEDEMNESQ